MPGQHASVTLSQFSTCFKYMLLSKVLYTQWRQKMDNWGGGGAHIHIFVFTDCKNNLFQKKLMMQNTNISILAPPPLTFDGSSFLPSHSSCTLCGTLVLWSSVSFMFLLCFAVSVVSPCVTCWCLSAPILPVFSHPKR